ncbi:MAG: NAD-binding protein [Planctomycetes bacterium]|nr:NAD-binding protein [Planctomycetota bacterium]
MIARRLDNLRLPPIRQHPANSRVWREWCFARVLFRNFRIRLLMVGVILAIGTTLFYFLDRETRGDVWLSLYSTWVLIFAQPPEALPRYSPPLMLLFFLVPVAGVLIVIETIVDFSLTLRDRPLLIADARRDSVLVEANVAAARSIVCATDDDLTNLEVALDARRLNPKVRVILRMFDQNMADKVSEGFNIRMAMSQTALSAPSFAMAAIDASIANTFVVDDELVVMQRWSVRSGGSLIGKTVGEVLADHRFGIVKRQPRDGHALLFPPPNTRLEEGDQLMAQGSFESLVRLRAQGLLLT